MAFDGLSDAYRTAADEVPVLDPEAAAKDPRKAQGELTRAQWDLYEQTTAKGEDALIDFALDDTLPDQYADDAIKDINTAYDKSAGQTERRLSRFGVTMDSDQQKVSDRLRGLERSLAVSGGANVARQGVSDLQLETLGAVNQIGAGIAAQSASNISSAANLQSGREALNASIRAQNDAAANQRRQGLVSGALTGAGIGASLGAAGAFGLASAGVGAAWGAGAGLLLAFL